jgi:glutamate-5-semialdehyde dehydrogenase
MIYESRPNVTIEAASLAIKSGNACILRGGSEAIHSNLALWKLVQAALAEAGLPPDAVQLVQTTDRAAVGHLIASPEAVDVIIPRGGKGLIERISREAKVPVIKHLDGNCHVLRRCERRPRARAACHRQREDAEVQPLQCGRVAARARSDGNAFLPTIGASSRPRASRCAAMRRARAAAARAERKLVDATEQDWARSTSRRSSASKVVDSLDDAIAHINRYGSHHTDAILTDTIRTRCASCARSIRRA